MKNSTLTKSTSGTRLNPQVETLKRALGYYSKGDTERGDGVMKHAGWRRDNDSKKDERDKK